VGVWGGGGGGGGGVVSTRCLVHGICDMAPSYSCYDAFVCT